MGKQVRRCAWAAVVVGIATTGCADDDGTSCGDGVCDADESHASCGFDCPASGPFCGDGTCNGAETVSSCATDCRNTACNTSPDSCTGDNVCVGGTCSQAFGRVYRVVMFDGTMTQNNATGSTWDAAGGLPDPLVQLTLNGTSLGMSSAKQDTLTPTWNESLQATIPAGSTFVVSVMDEDVTVDDTMFSCQSAPLTAALLRVHGPPYVTCSGTGPLAAAQVRFYFMPQ